MLVGATSIFAQDISTTEIKVVEGFVPEVPDAIRLNEQARFSDTIKKDRAQNYEILNVNLASDYKTKPLSAAHVKDDKISKLHSTKIGFGFGSSWTTQGSLVHNSKRSKNISYGVIFDHFAHKYSVASNNKNIACLYAKKITSSHIFNLNLDYDRRVASYYGDDPIILSNSSYKLGDLKNRFAYTKLTLAAISKQDSNQKLNHSTRFFLSDLNEFSENELHVSSNFSRLLYELPFCLAIRFDNYFRYYNPEIRLEEENLKYFSFSPSTSIKKYGFDFDFSVDFEFLSDNPVGLFPQIGVTKELVQDILLLNGGLRYSSQMQTLKLLSDQNPYIHSFGSNQSIIGSLEPPNTLKLTGLHEFYLAMRNLLGKNEVFEGSIAYGKVKNLAYFNVDDHRFEIEYVDAKQLHAYAIYNKSINELVDLELVINYFAWNKKVYQKPNVTLKFSAPINLRDKIKAAPSISYMSPRRLTESGVFLSHQFHVNIGLYYFYSEQLSAYLQLNNLTNSKEDFFWRYREIGFNGLVGLEYLF